MPKARPDRIAPARQRGKADGARKPGTASRAPRVLAIDGGETLTLLERCRRPPALVLAHGRDLEAPLIERVAPRAVVFALFAEQNDALAILGRLARAGHGGRIFALSPPLPNPRMVERELKGRFPALRLRILQILPPLD